MRSDPRNSREAAARILALVLIADGQMCSAEIAVLRAMGAELALGLEPDLLPHASRRRCGWHWPRHAPMAAWRTGRRPAAGSRKPARRRAG